MIFCIHTLFFAKNVRSYNIAEEALLLNWMELTFARVQQDGNPNCRNPNGGPENMGSCRMGGAGPMGPGVSMGPMSASEAQTLPSNVISKQAGSMEVIIKLFKHDFKVII